jgi:hypothetical protein
MRSIKPGISRFRVWFAHLNEARGASRIAISSQTTDDNKNVGFECHVARGIPRDGITARGDRQ